MDEKTARKNRQESREKLNSLLLKKNENEARITEIDNLIQSVGKPTEENPLTTAARAMISGEETTAPIAHIQTWKNERDELSKNRRVIEEAVRLQKIELQEKTGMLARAVGDARRPEYMALMKDHVRALIAVSRTIEAITNFRDEFTKDDISFSCGQNLTAYHHIGRLSDRGSFLNYWLCELVKNKGITQAELDELIAESVA